MDDMDDGTVACPRCDGAGEIEVSEDRLDARGEHYTRDWRESCRDCCGTGRLATPPTFRITLVSSGETLVGLNGAPLTGLTRAAADRVVRELREVWARELIGDGLGIELEGA